MAMKIVVHCSLFVLPLALLGCGTVGDDGGAAGEATAATAAAGLTAQEQALALAWAPIHFQDISPDGGHSLSGKADFVVRINYDGEYTLLNNWDNLGNVSLDALDGWAYTTVSESDTHYFIYYMFYHARSWTNNTFIADEHENDGEGCMLLVRKDGSTYGRLQAVITNNHTNWKTYTASPNLGRGAQNGETPAAISFESGHPQTYQEYEGHGLRGCTNSNNCGLTANNDVVKYVPAQGSWSVPPWPVPGLVTRTYQVADMVSEVYSRRFDRPTFASPQTMAGNSSGGCGDGFPTCSNDAATGMWSFEPSFQSDGANGSGEDPAKVFAALFSFNNGLSPPSSNYVSNKLLHAKCTTGRRMMGSPDACVQQICAADPYCCANAWDAYCVGEVTSVCGLQCQNCDANICHATASGPIGNGCDGKCAASIAAVDPYCAQAQWDSICVGEVASVCRLDCTGL
jgi:hypothetical protein